MKKHYLLFIIAAVVCFSGCATKHVEGTADTSSVEIKEEITSDSGRDEMAPEVEEEVESFVAPLEGDMPGAPAAKPKSRFKTAKRISSRKVPSASGLKAGFADDNKQFNFFLNFLKKYGGSVRKYDLNIEERIILTIKDAEGKTLPDAQVCVKAGRKELCTGTTYSDGTFMMFPSEFSKKHSKYDVEMSYAGHTEKLRIDRQGKRHLDIQLNCKKETVQSVPVDILFVLDTTGSMGEEISRLKSTIEIIKMNLASLPSSPSVRFGMVLYKDRRDSYVTKVVPLTENLADFQASLNKVRASGGGDGPEDLQSALDDTLRKIVWNEKGIRLGFIITDAPPHLDYGQKYTYMDAARDAKKKGIKLFSVGTGGLDIMGEYILRQISQYTYAKYIFLTYGEKGESAGGKPGSVSHHTGSNFQTDKLEAIIIRIAKEELGHFTDSSLDEGEGYFEANKDDDEKSPETLKKLFDMAVSQLVDYSSINIAPGTPAGVIPITATDDDLNADAEYFTEHLIASFSQNKKFKAVERKDIQKIMTELKIGMSGLADDQTAAKVGKLIGAEMLAGGRLYEKKQGYEIFLKLLRVETGEVLAVTKLKIDKGLGLLK